MILTVALSLQLRTLLPVQLSLRTQRLMAGISMTSNLYPNNLLSNYLSLPEGPTPICSPVQQILLRGLHHVPVLAVAGRQVHRAWLDEEAPAPTTSTIAAQSWPQKPTPLSSRSSLHSVVILMSSAPSSSRVVAAPPSPRFVLLAMMAP